MTKPGHYWDFREAAWLRYAAPSVERDVVPDQRTDEPAATVIATATGDDVRSG